MHRKVIEPQKLWSLNGAHDHETSERERGRDREREMEEDGIKGREEGEMVKLKKLLEKSREQKIFQIMHNY